MTICRSLNSNSEMGECSSNDETSNNARSAPKLSNPPKRELKRAAIPREYRSTKNTQLPSRQRQRLDQIIRRSNCPSDQKITLSLVQPLWLARFRAALPVPPLRGVLS